MRYNELHKNDMLMLMSKGEIATITQALNEFVNNFKNNLLSLNVDEETINELMNELLANVLYNQFKTLCKLYNINVEEE